MQIEASLESADNARSILQPLVDEDPRNIDVKADLGRAYMGIGHALYGLGDFSGALEWHRKALPLFSTTPDVPQARVSTANDLIQLGRFREAIEHLESIATTTWVAQARRAVALWGIGDLHRADSVARPFIAMYHGVPRLGLGNLAGNPRVLNLGNFQARPRDVREAVQLSEEPRRPGPAAITARERAG